MSALREEAAAWFREAPRRLTLARLHGQMAALCQAEADAITDSYAWPPRDALTAEEREEVEHLCRLGDVAFDRLERLAPRRPDEPFYKFIFG